MGISQITKQNIKDYIRMDYDDDDSDLDIIMLAVKAYIKGYTGLTDEDMNTKDDLSIVYMVLCNELYSQRQYTVDNNKVNVVVKTILDMHSVNLL
ncbi:head-tail connector protein [Paenibacillus thailandensis]|uniref:Head-tail connector protein n=1 Tax=Paenibacillus thailandensis TaxID=393250 RepID=A0ABW5R302_9BACL